MPEQKTSSWEEKFDRKIKRLEKRIEEIGKYLEEKDREVEEKIENRIKAVDRRIGSGFHSGHGLFWGIVLIAVGFIWLGNNLDWFSYEIPWVPVTMIAIGIYLILRYWEKDKVEISDSHSKGGSKTKGG